MRVDDSSIQLLTAFFPSLDQTPVAKSPKRSFDMPMIHESSKKKTFGHEVRGVSSWSLVASWSDLHGRISELNASYLIPPWEQTKCESCRKRRDNKLPATCILRVHLMSVYPYLVSICVYVQDNVQCTLHIHDC